MTHMLRVNLVACLLIGQACGDDDTMLDGGGADVAPGDSGVADASETDAGDASTDAAFDTQASCVAGETLCAAGRFRTCVGERYDEGVVCDEACDDTLGCVACEPGARVCDGDVSRLCLGDGSGFAEMRDCAEAGATCGASGYCDDACGEAEAEQSSLGCEFWPRSLTNGIHDGIDNALISDFTFRVVATNPAAVAANVRVAIPEEMEPSGELEIANTMVAAQSTEVIELYWDRGTDAISAERDWRSSTLSNARLVSDQPIHLAQYNPYELTVSGPFMSLMSFSGDASLLLPAHMLGTEYYVVTRPALSAGFDTFPDGRGYSKTPGYMTIVGVSDEPTEVEVLLAAATAEGEFPAMPAGSTLRLTVQRDSALTIYAAAPPDCEEGRPGFSTRTLGDQTRDECEEARTDLTGSRVSADRPIAVFGGHACANVPYNEGTCDHLESQLLPTNAWGTRFATGPIGERNLVRVLAAEAGTVVTVTTAENVTNVVLDAGRFHEFDISAGVELSASHPVSVTQFLAGDDETTTDPSMFVVPSSANYEGEYTFIAPPSYNTESEGQNYVLIVRPRGQPVQLDGEEVADWTLVSLSEWALVAVDGGVHRLTSPAEFGAVVAGLGPFVSYARLAGARMPR